MTEKLIQNTALTDIKKIAHYFDDKEYDLNKILSTAIERKEWLTTAKIINIIQLNPKIIYLSNLCDLIIFHSDEFHPEEAIDAISDILDLEISEEDCEKIIKSFEQLLFGSRKDDPAFNINIKCLANLEWIVRLKMDSSKTALNLIKKAANYNNAIVANEARECIDLLINDNYYEN